MRRDLAKAARCYRFVALAIIPRPIAHAAAPAASQCEFARALCAAITRFF